MKNYGLQYPFADSEKGDYLKLTTTQKERIKSNVTFLLFTKKGTVRNKPEFGCDLTRFLFEPNDEHTQNNIQNEVINTVKNNFKDLTVENVEIINSGNNMVGLSFFLVFNDIYLKDKEKINILF
jgi:phage baseplate assembly protein W